MIVCSITPPTPRSTLFPYTTLFRSHVAKLIVKASILSSIYRRVGPSLRTDWTLPKPLRENNGGRRTVMIKKLKTGYRRSEEHTSELQSRVDLVCRLLLEKKNKNIRS